MNGEIKGVDIDPPVNRLEVNKVLRVLNGNPQKYTVHLLMSDGSERQIQVPCPPMAQWNEAARCLMYAVKMNSSDYELVPLCRFDDVVLLQCEENPT